ncbi:MAG: cysteine-rich CWC family protein [Filimonas sp.]|nr:cysteine-rich CWC family protein [Filimonas sp.]
MPHHEHKKCPRCQKTFECKVGDITHCQCYGLTFTDEEKKFIEERFNDCLCVACLYELKNKYVLFKEKFLQ